MQIPYTYQVQANDPDAGDTLVYRLLQKPDGMDIDDNGQITWNAPVSGQYRVVVGVEDSRGLATAQSFTLTTRDNQAPRLESTPVPTTIAGTTYRYDLRAIDPNGDHLTYSLDAASVSKGITLDSLGRLRWSPTATQIGAHDIVLTATDALGASSTQAFTLTVQADAEKPLINLTANVAEARVGDSVTFRVNATDNVAVTSLELQINGQSYAIDSNGLATVQVMENAPITAVVVAKDGAGNTETRSLSVTIAPENNQAPSVSLNLQETIQNGNRVAIENGMITAPTNILGTVNDPDNNLDYYTLEVASLADGVFREIYRSPSGITPIADGVLDQFDPTLLQNDTYTLRLTAYDKSGFSSSTEGTIEVSSELKLGNFRLSFTDLAVPVTGIPITLTRTYDSLTSTTSDDFGYGWRMEFRDTDLRTSLGRDRQYEEIGVRSQAFDDKTRVYITLPGGKREGFTFKPKQVKSIDGQPLGLFAKYMYAPEFVADKGSTSTLTVEQAYITRGSNGKYYGLNQSGYNPADAESGFGGVYVLTTKDGTQYRIDAATGDLLTVSDTNGNTLTYSDDAVTSSTGKTVTFERDAQGRITSVQDPMGELIRYEYNSNGDLISVTDQEKNETRFTYDPQRSHYLKEVIDPLKRTGARTEYDENGRLQQVVNGAGVPINIEYKPEESIQIVKDVYGNPTTYRYDDRGNVLEVKNALGFSNFFEYDANNNLTQTRDANNLVTKYEYDTRGNLISKTEAYCGCAGVVPGTTYYTYDGRGQMQDLVLPTGASMHLKYDTRGNMLSMSDGKGGVIQSFTYYDNGLVKTETDTAGTTTYEYNDFGDVIKTIDADGNATSMQYYDNGLLQSMTEDNGTPDDFSDDQTSTFSYDKLGREERADYGNGIWVEYGYEGSGGDWMTLDAPTIGHIERKLTEDGKLGGWITPDGGTPTFTYDQAGRLWRETDATGRVTTEYGYDAAGRLTTVKDVRTGAVTTKRYDAGNRVTEEIDPLGGFTRYDYDTPRNGGKLKSVTRGQYLKDASGNWVVDTTVALQTTSFEYNGTRTTVTDALGRKTTSVIDEYSLPIETIFEQRNGQDYSTKTSYLYTSNLQEAKDYPTQTIDIGGNDHTFTYDEQGRLRTATDLGNGTYSYTYGDDGLALIESPLSQTTTGLQKETLGYGYDPIMGNLTSVTYGDGTTKQMTYRPQDNRLGTVTLQSGETITYDYDEAGRIESQITKAADGMVIGTVSYTYTANGSMDTVTDDKTGVTDYDYDPTTGALSRITYGNGSSIAYTYDLLGRTKTITEKASASGTAYTTTYDYDTFGNLKSVLDPAGGLTMMKYDVGNRLMERSLPNGVKSVYQYDDLDRVKSITHTNTTGQVLASVTYERNGIGEPTKITREDGTFTKLEYDEALRVKQESFFSSTGTLVEETSYTYDAAGKRTATTTTVGTQTTSDTYNYTAGYQLDSVTGSNGADDYQFDANGRLTLIQRDGVTLDLEHDAGDRLTTIENTTTGSTTQYVYDGQGNRVGAIEGTEVRQFLVAPSMGNGLNSTDLIADGNGNLISNYVYAGGASPFMMLDANGNPVYYLSDGMGSVIGLANGNGNEVGDFRYDSFGNVREEWGGAISSTRGDFRFQGQWLEADTGIYHFRARDYDAQTGTFLSRDPIDPTQQQPESLNPYQFTYNNPYVYSDPTGMFTITELNAAQNLQTQLSTVRTYAGNQAKDYLKQRIGDAFGEVVTSVFNYFVPTGGGLAGELSRLVSAGDNVVTDVFETFLIDKFCEYFEGVPLIENLRLYPRVQQNGTPTTRGINCAGDDGQTDPRVSRRLQNQPGSNPEFIFINGAYRRNNSNGYLIGDIKIIQRAAYDEVIGNENQWRAMSNYAREWQLLPFVSYVSLMESAFGQPGVSRSDKERMASRALGQGVVLVLANLID